MQLHAIMMIHNYPDNVYHCGSCNTIHFAILLQTTANKRIKNPFFFPLWNKEKIWLNGIWIFLYVKKTEIRNDVCQTKG